MKKLIALILAVILASLIAFAENTDKSAEEIIETEMIETEDMFYEIAGVVAEITEEGILINAAESGMVMIKSDAETVVDSADEIAAGDYIIVIYDGIMSRSIPARITADLIRMYAITGEVISFDREGENAMIMTENHGEVMVRLAQAHQENPEYIEINESDIIKVYFDGAMTMSVPPQIGARYVVAGE